MTWPLLVTRRQFLAASSGVAAFTWLAGSAHVSALQPAGPDALALHRANESLAQQSASEFALAGYMTRE